MGSSDSYDSTYSYAVKGAPTERAWKNNDVLKAPFYAVQLQLPTDLASEADAQALLDALCLLPGRLRCSLMHALKQLIWDGCISSLKMRHPSHACDTN